ncbi:MAG: response regulator transcription factor [Proteobacteria bacterium]|nr:response regulator transcription factor [Pseudomonadota bacterium]
MTGARATTDSLSVVIVDDEPAGRRAIRECCEREPDLRVVGEYGDSESALEALQRSPPDVLFLDIQIDSMTGTALARRLDPQTLPLIVFVTAFDHYALEAFEVSAIDYLLKPFDDGRFQKTLERVRLRHRTAGPRERHTDLTQLLERLERQAQAAATDRPRLIAERGGKMRVLDVGDIELVESDRNYVKLTCGAETFALRGTMQQVESSLRSQPMLRISRSCLVNSRHIREISKTPRGDLILVMAGGATVTSSEGYRDSVRQYLDRMKLAPPAGG